MLDSNAFARKVLIEFRTADALLAKQLNLSANAAAAEQSSVTNTANETQQYLDNYLHQAEAKKLPADLEIASHVPSEIRTQFEILRGHIAAIHHLNNKLTELHGDKAKLEHEYQVALAHEKSHRFALRVGFAAIVVSIIACLVFLHFGLLDKTTVSFAVALDGKPLPTNKIPVIALDENPFTNGSRVNLGRHRIAVRLQDAELFERKFWAFYGNNDLGVLPLVSIKGALSVTVTPSPAMLILQHGGGVLLQTNTPLNLERIPIGRYVLVARRGTYEEKYSVEVNPHQKTDVKVELNLGSAKLVSIPPDAEFELSGGGRSWRGSLPAQIEDIPVGTFQLTAKRKGWEVNRSLVVSRGNVSNASVEFEYASIAVTSEPSSLIVSSNGIEIGKTPMTLNELQPGDYALAVTDGVNDLTADVHVRPKEAAARAFVFRYGTVDLSSVPTGATVIRKGKAVGKTPLTLERVPAETTMIQFRLDGYVSTNFPTIALAGQKTNYTVKLFSERFVAAIEQASQSLFTDEFENAKKFITVALELDPQDLHAVTLQKEITHRADAWKKNQLEVEKLARDAKAKRLAQELAQFPVLSPTQIIEACWSANKRSYDVRTPSASNEQFSKLNTPEAARQNPVATPVWVATDAIVKTIEGTAWSVKKLASIGKSSTPNPPKTRFDYVLLNPYLRAQYRYYGEITKVDEKTLTITFASGGTGKKSYEITARFVGHIPDTIASAPLKTPAWVSGTLTWLEENPEKNSSPANRFILDNCTTYPADTLPANR